ncbi:MAG: IPT/TIG domain-containing protein, partial [Dehalococcoidia bacterium]
DYTSTTAAIYWTTNTTSDSVVRYGTTTPPTQVESDSSDVTTHFIYLTGLTPDTTYYFQVESTDVSGTSIDDNGGSYYQFTTEAVTDYSITLDHACGVCGELIDVGLCGEVIGVTAIVAAGGTYHICWDSRTADNVVGTFTTTGAASRTLTFYMPEAKKGIHTVYLVDNTFAEKASAEFEVNPSVKIDNDEGPVGTEVTLNGYGFGASQDVRVSFLDEEETDDADAKGSWEVSLTIPPTPAGGYTFDVEAKEGTVWVGWVSKYFKVTPEIAAPNSGKVGQTIEVEGTGFANEEDDVEVTFDGEAVKPSTYPNVDENGSWSAIIRVPTLQAGTYSIDASGRTTRARDVPDVEFTVSPGILVEPGSAYVGDTITVTGGGFEPDETGIKVSFGGTVVATGITAEGDGTWVSSFELQASTYGSHTVSASGDITPVVETTLNTKARIEDVSPSEGAPGDSVSLTGSGFGGSEDLAVTIGGIAASGDMVTQSNGNVVVSFRVPKGTTQGIRTLVVTDEGEGTASAEFTVTEKTLSTTPIPISPEGSTLRSGEVTFQWQGVTGSTGYTYTLDISTTPDSDNIWSKSGIEGSSYPLTEQEALPKGTYYWRVKIVDDYGNEGPWSDSIEFRVSPIPTLVWVVVGLVVLVALMVVAYRGTKFKVTE